MNPASGFKVADWTVLPLEGRLVDGDEEIHVRPKAMDVLCCLAARAGQVVERDALLSEVWGRTAVTDEPLTSAVAELRRALGDRRGQPRYIETIPKRGYRLIAEVRPLEPAPADEPAGTPPPAASPASRRSPWTDPAWVAAGFLGVVALLALWVIAAREPGPSPDAERTIAVLPFTNIGEDPGNAYFADGLAEELTTMLTRVEGLRVSARTSAFQFEDGRAEPAEIGRQLGVRTLLVGSVRKSGESLRITAQLVDVGSGYHLWAGSYDRGLDDIFAVQSDIASAIARTLEVTLLEGEREALTARRARDPQAYDLYLKALSLFHRAEQEADLRRGLDLFQQAIAIDPDFALAYAGAGRMWLLLADGGYVSPQEGYALGRAALKRSLELDPELAEGHHGLGWVQLFHDWDWAAARASFARALDLQPGSADVINANAVLNYSLARLDQAVAQARQAAALDPLRSGMHYNLAYLSFAAGDLETADRAAQRSIALVEESRGRHLLRALIALRRGDTDAAAGLVAAEPDPALRLMGRALVEIARGELDAARATAKRLETEFGDAVAYQIAEVYANLGDADRAFEQLELAWEHRDPGMAELLVDPLMEPIRSDPRYATWIERLGFPGPAGAGPG